ncbi:MAG: hypothetical protein P1U41_06055 [Vicingaceae bacterium]|nr:hypothetical protein [Vicingaceae bacterium]
MKHLLILTFSLLISEYAFSQSQNGSSTIFKEAKPGETVKIIFDVSNHTSNHIGVFKDVLLNFKNQVIRAHYDEINNSFTLTYNDNIKVSTLIEIFSEYNINYKNNNSNVLTY